MYALTKLGVSKKLTEGCPPIAHLPKQLFTSNQNYDGTLYAFRMAQESKN